MKRTLKILCISAVVLSATILLDRWIAATGPERFVGCGGTDELRENTRRNQVFAAHVHLDGLNSNF